MEGLPPEITSEVLRNMSKRDFKVMRMVSRKFYAISSQLLFFKVYASLHWKDLIVLIKISRHPALRLAVQEVVYCGVFFPTSQPERTGGSSEGSLDQYYCDRIEEQNAVLEGGINAATISAALARMPNVRRVILTNHWRPTRDLFGHCTFATRFLGRVSIPDDARFGGPLHRDYPLCLKLPSGRPLRIGDKNSGGMKIDHGFLIMCQAVSTARTPVQELAVDYYDGALDKGHHGLTAGISPGSLKLSTLDLEHFCSAFRHLRKIAFSLCNAKTDGEWDILMQGNLSQLLAAANDLEELTFDFTSYDNDIPLAKCLGTHSWPRLCLLRLFRKQMQEAELTGLLHRHRKTLKVLHLESVKLTDGTWQKAAEEMRQWLNLESVTCDELCERVDSWNVKSVWCDELENYIVHGESSPIVDPNYRPQTPTTFSTTSNDWYDYD